jgi:hypothetical protein
VRLPARNPRPNYTNFGFRRQYNRPRATTTSLGQRLHPSLHWKINRSVKCLFKERWCRNLDF